MKNNKYTWKLKDILMVALLSSVFAFIYLQAVYLMQSLKAVLTPFGLAPFGAELIFGIWFSVATFAAYIIRKPGVAIISEMLAAFIEVLMGNFYGPIVFVSGFVQGLGAELAFAGFKYKRWDRKSMFLAAFLCTVLSFIWGFFRSGFLALSPLLLLAMFIVRLLSSLFFAGILPKYLADRLAKAGVLRSFAIGQDQAAPVEGA